MGKRFHAISVVCITACLITLFKSRAFFGPYLITALFALYCLGKDRSAQVARKSAVFRITVVVSFISAVFITLANYDIWLHPQMPDIRSSLFVRIIKLALILIIMSGTFVSVYAILIHMISNIDTILYTPCENDRRKNAEVSFEPS